MYEPYYGLNAKPFRLTPDPSFLFESASHRKALSYLRYGAYCAEGFVVVVGAPGTGKTTLIKKVLAELPESEVIVAKLVTTQLAADDILRSLAGSLGLEFEGLTKAGLLNSIEKFLKEKARNNRRVLVLVDEAHHLPAEALEELRMLTNFQEDEHALMQCFLIGQEELKTMVDSPAMEQFRQRVIASCHLKPLTGSETVAYIEHRLDHAGWDGNALFSFGAYELIYRQTGGVPRLVNNLCERMLLRGYLEDCQEIDENLALSVIEEVAGESGDAAVLSELHDAKEAIREVRRALRVVDNGGAVSAEEPDRESPDEFRFQTISEQALADTGGSCTVREASLSQKLDGLDQNDRVSTIAPSKHDAGQSRDLSASPSPALKSELDEMPAPSVANYVEAATETLMMQHETTPETADRPDPTPYFGAQKARAPLPDVDRSYQPVQAPVRVSQSAGVAGKPSLVACLRKQLVNIAIALVLAGVTVVLFIFGPERPLELESQSSAVEQLSPLGVTAPVVSPYHPPSSATNSEEGAVASPGDPDRATQ